MEWWEYGIIIHLLNYVLVLILGYLVKFNDNNKDSQYKFWLLCPLFPLLGLILLPMLWHDGEFEKIDQGQVKKLHNIVYFLPLLSLGLLYFI